MKSILLLPLFFFILLNGHAQKDLEAKVLETEKSRFEAMVSKDIDQLNELIGDDLYYIHSNGNVDTKASFIDNIQSGRSSYDNITIDNAKVRIYGKTAIINGECTYYRKNEDGSPNNLRLRYTNVYVQQNKKWKMVTWQSFKII